MCDAMCDFAHQVMVFVSCVESEQLATVFTTMFNACLTQCVVSTCFKKFVPILYNQEHTPIQP